MSESDRPEWAIQNVRTGNLLEIRLNRKEVYLNPFTTDKDKLLIHFKREIERIAKECYEPVRIINYYRLMESGYHPPRGEFKSRCTCNHDYSEYVFTHPSPCVYGCDDIEIIIRRHK